MNTSCVQTIIHTQALQANIRFLQERHPAFMPIVKADAYGHGRDIVARALQTQGVNHMAVGTVGEAVRLRQQNIHGELVALMGLTCPEDAALAQRNNVTVLMHSPENLELAVRHARSGNAETAPPLALALKIDTGMSRLGFAPERVPDLVRQLAQTPELRPALVLSHLASADDPAQDAFTLSQISRFQQAAAVLCAAFPGIKTSLGNSPGLLGWPGSAGDLPRPGLALYGVNPFAGTCKEALGHGLSPVMEATAPVLAVHDLQQGQSAGYGCAFVAPDFMRVAVVAAGYADGYPRSLSRTHPALGQNRAGQGAVLIHGQRAPLIGRVCMQMCLANVTGIPHVTQGDTAYLLGGPGQNTISVLDLAGWAETIPYEILCNLGKNRRLLVD